MCPSRQTVQNNREQLSSVQFVHRYGSTTVGEQLKLMNHLNRPILNSPDVYLSETWLVLYSVHEQPSALSAFAGLDSEPFQRCKVFSFDKQHGFDLGII